MEQHEWVSVLSARYGAEAEIVRALLQAEGIPVMVQSELPKAVYPALSFVSVLVPKEKLEIARSIIESYDAEAGEQD